MTIYERQYASYFSYLGYSVEFYEDKSLFFIKELNAYAKMCSDPPLPEIIEKAEKSCLKNDIILLDGNLSFKPYTIYRKNYDDNGFTSIKYVLVIKDRKYSPYFFEKWFDLDIWKDEAAIIAACINNNQSFECHQCGLVDDITVSKPSLHYKVSCACGAYITNVSENKPSSLFFGKYKGRAVASMKSDEEIRYLQWGLSQNIFKGKLKRDIEERVKSA